MRAEKAVREIYDTYRGSLLQNPDHRKPVPRYEELSDAEQQAWLHAWLHAEDIMISEQLEEIRGRKK